MALGGVYVKGYDSLTGQICGYVALHCTSNGPDFYYFYNFYPKKVMHKLMMCVDIHYEMVC